MKNFLAKVFDNELTNDYVYDNYRFEREEFHSDWHLENKEELLGILNKYFNEIKEKRPDIYSEFSNYFENWIKELLENNKVSEIKNLNNQNISIKIEIKNNNHIIFSLYAD